MSKRKRKLTRAEKQAKARRRAEYMTIFVNGKQKQVRRPTRIEGLTPDEFIARNADPIWLVQNEMWEELYALECAGDRGAADEVGDDDVPSYWRRV
jgi:hypothetical protein